MYIHVGICVDRQMQAHVLFLKPVKILLAILNSFLCAKDLHVLVLHARLHFTEGMIVMVPMFGSPQEGAATCSELLLDANKPGPPADWLVNDS